MNKPAAASVPAGVPVSIDDYLRSCPPAVRARLEEVRRTVHGVADGMEEVISYRMPAIRHHGIVVYFAAFKNHIGLYPPVAGDPAVERDTAPYAGEKGNLRFPHDQPLPLELIRRIAAHRVQQNLAKVAAKKSARRRK